MLKYSFVFLIALQVSCDYFKQEEQRKPIARVNDHYLYVEDLKDLLYETTTKEDSALIVNNYIKRWATQQLLIRKSKVNLSQEQQDAFNRLVEDYRVALYTGAYKSKVISQQLDSLISKEELEGFYEANKDSFRLNDELLKVRYIHLDKGFLNLKKVKEKFIRFNNEDKKDLTEMSIKFKDSNLNDSIWIKSAVLLDKIPLLSKKKKKLIKKTNFTQLQDSIGVYLVKIENRLTTNDIAPLPYVESVIKQIILNKRKQELIKNLEKEITVDAIKNNNFETYKIK